MFPCLRQISRIQDAAHVSKSAHGRAPSVMPSLLVHSPFVYCSCAFSLWEFINDSYQLPNVLFHSCFVDNHIHISVRVDFANSSEVSEHEACAQRIYINKPTLIAYSGRHPPFCFNRYRFFAKRAVSFLIVPESYCFPINNSLFFAARAFAKRLILTDVLINQVLAKAHSLAPYPVIKGRLCVPDWLHNFIYRISFFFMLGHDPRFLHAVLEFIDPVPRLRSPIIAIVVFCKKIFDEVGFFL